jgi:tetratricopeptide (TPR) repeat protein
MATAPHIALAQTGDADLRGDTPQQTLERLRDDSMLQGLRDQKERDREEGSVQTQAEKLRAGSGIMDNLPSEANLQKLRLKIEQEPDNLDHYFDFAQMAARLGNHASAARAYEAMLAKQPGLDRVKLDLAVTYTKLERYEDAQALLNDVLTRQPPEAVKANIESVLARIGTELIEHEWGGNIIIGVNLDSNGNSAPGDGHIVIFDLDVPLGADQRAQQDLQGFAGATLNHSYKPREWRGKEIAVRWDSTASVYQAEQSSLENLNLKVLSLRSGPNISIPEQGLNFKPYVGHSVIALAGDPYLRTSNAGMDSSWQLTPQLQLQAGARYELRDFHNSDTVSTYADRTGNATQGSLGLRYFVTGEDIISASVMSRHERTRRDYHDNEQWQATLGYTRILPWQSFATLSTSYKNTVYDDNDALISAKRRHDKETTGGLTLGKKLNDTLTATVGYQYRDVQSNIPNYDYGNHRWSAALSAAF